MTSRVAQAYYDSRDAHEFYRRVWGGEDIHIGLYESPGDSVAEARTPQAGSPEGVYGEAGVPTPRRQRG